MKTHNAQNERVKHAYFTYLREAKGMSEASIDQTAKALSRFEAYSGYRDFKQFHRKQAEAFKQHLAGQLEGDRLALRPGRGVHRARRHVLRRAPGR
jgi:hypothetical protein